MLLVLLALWSCQEIESLTPCCQLGRPVRLLWLTEDGISDALWLSMPSWEAIWLLPSLSGHCTLEPWAMGEAQTLWCCQAKETHAVYTEAEVCHVLQVLCDFDCTETPKTEPRGTWDQEIMKLPSVMVVYHIATEHWNILEALSVEKVCYWATERCYHSEMRYSIS